MEPVLCARCGKLIEDDESVEFVGRVFCSDACCEEFDGVVTTVGEPVVDDLDAEISDGADVADVADDLDDLDDLDDGFSDEDDFTDELEIDFEDADY